MAVASYPECLARLLTHEGGYTNDAADPGGPTNYGITIFDYRKYVKPGATAADVRAMKLDEAKAIYKSKYWDALHCDQMPAGLDDTMFDYGVNSGISRAGKVLRRVLGMPADDWRVTLDVLTEISRRDVKALISAVNNERLRFLKSLKTWPVFGKGWGRRVGEVTAFSLALAGGAPKPVVVLPATGKGAHPAPKVSKPAAGVGTGVAVAAGGGFLDWITAHPQITVAVVIAVAAVGVAIFKIIANARELKQETPMPVTPVPAIA